MTVDEVVEGEVQLSPGGGDWASLGEIIGYERVGESEAVGEDPAMGLGEEHGYTAAEGGQRPVCGDLPGGSRAPLCQASMSTSAGLGSR